MTEAETKALTEAAEYLEKTSHRMRDRGLPYESLVDSSQRIRALLNDRPAPELHWPIKTA